MKTTKNFGQDSLSLSRDLNPGPPEYELSTRLRGSVRYLLNYVLATV
jgi:hypothetical protein